GSPTQGDVEACTDSQGESAEDSSAEDFSTTDSQAYVSSIDDFKCNKFLVSDNMQFEAFLNPTVEEQGTRTTNEEGLREDSNNESNNSEAEADKYGPMDTSLLMHFETHITKVAVLGHGISLSLVKMVDFLAYKLGRNAYDPVEAEASSFFKPVRLSSRAVAKTYMLTITKRSSKEAFKMFREALNNYKLEDEDLGKKGVFYFKFDQSRSNEIWSHSNDFRGVGRTIASHEPREGFRFGKTARPLKEERGYRGHLYPYLEKREDRHTFKKVASFTGKWKDFLISIRGRKVHDTILACSEGYFEWFNSFSFTKLCPDVVDLDENDDGGILKDGGGVLHSKNVEGRNEDLRRLEEEISNLKSEVNSLKSAKETVEYNSLRESNKKLSKDVLDNIELKNSLADLHLKFQKKMLECETLTAINEKLMDEVVNQEPQPLVVTKLGCTLRWKRCRSRRLEAKEVWCLTLKGAIEGGDFEDTEDLIWEELSLQITKLLTIAQEGPKGEYQDDLILPGGVYQNDRFESMNGNSGSGWIELILVEARDLTAADLRETSDPYVKLLCGGLVGSTAALFTTPFDVVKTRLQTETSLKWIMAMQIHDIACCSFYHKQVSILEQMNMPSSLEGGRLHQQQGGLNILTYILAKRKHRNYQIEETKYLSPIPPVSTLWWAHVQLEIPDDFMKAYVKSYFEAPNQA
ncbi:hypothetical protein GIB67_000567, partial [Kingdonia uniflora]